MKKRLEAAEARWCAFECALLWYSTPSDHTDGTTQLSLVAWNGAVAHGIGETRHAVSIFPRHSFKSSSECY